MVLDAYNLYSDAQAVTANAASTNLIDHGAVRDLGTGEDLYIVCLVDVAMTDSSSNSTCTVTLETDDNSSFSSATTGQTLFVFSAVSAAGTVKIARIQPDALNERYSRLYYTMAGGDLSAGSFTAFITHDVQKYVSYADNIVIS